jgi:hypothetical protein
MDILPDSRPRHLKGRWHAAWGVWCVEQFCVNCGADGGWVPETTTSSTYFCERCAADPEIQRVAGTWLIPDEVMHRLMVAEIRERNLTPQQAAEDTTLVKLARDF